MGMREYNLVLSQKDARKFVKDGINLATDTIAPTLGAKSRRVLLDAEYADIDACDDGSTILNKINVEDTRLNLGVKVARECASKTNTDEGDGTSSTTVILRELVNQLLEEDSQEELLFKKQSGSNLKIRKEIKEGLRKVLDYIDKHKIEVTSKEQIVQVGKVSSNSKEVGEMLADMFEKLGKDGALTIEEGKNIETEYEVVSGMSVDSGWLAPQFVTNENEEAVLEPGEEGFVNVLITATKIQDINHMKKLAELFEGGVNDLLIIAEEVSGIPLNSLVVNKMRQVIRTVAVKAPTLGTMQETLKDICAATGATLIGGDDGIKFEELKKEHLGKAKRVVVDRRKTVILGDGNEDKIKERVTLLKNRLKNENSEYEKNKLKERISKLTGGVGNIKVGGATSMEIKDKKAKVTDAVAAIRSALRDGIVAGGGVTLLLASQELNETIEGEKILKNAIKKPFYQIMENADVDGKEIEKKVLETGHGLNVETEEFGDLVELGVIDPSGVVKACLNNSVSSALMVANLSASVNLLRKTDKEDENT